MLASGALKPSRAEDRVVTLVAGLATRNSQKLHNLIYAIERLPKDEGRLVLMLDDDMILGDKAVPVLVEELLKDPKCLRPASHSARKSTTLCTLHRSLHSAPLSALRTHCSPRLPPPCTVL